MVQEKDRLALVSSLYGPGSVACWLLTWLSLLVTWTLHPRKQNSGSVEVDFVAYLTLVVVANGHLVSQVQNLLDQSRGTRSTIGGSRAQLVAALEAPIVILDTTMTMTTILGFVAIQMQTKRRITLIVIVGTLSIITSCYIYLSGFSEPDLEYDPMAPSTHESPKFSRFHCIDFPDITAGVSTAFLVTCLINAMLHLLLPSLGLSPYPNIASHLSGVQGGSSEQRVYNGRETTSSLRLQRLRTPPKKRVLEGSAFAMVCFLIPTALVIHLTILHLSCVNHDSVVSAQTHRQKLRQYATRMFSNLFPQSPHSITDLDQAVVVAGGASILAFRIYGVAKARFEIWKNKATLPVASSSLAVATSGEENNDIELESQPP